VYEVAARTALMPDTSVAPCVATRPQLADRSVLARDIGAKGATAAPLLSPGEISAAINRKRMHRALHKLDATFKQ
jgi:hypothetical protein